MTMTLKVIVILVPNTVGKWLKTISKVTANPCTRPVLGVVILILPNCMLKIYTYQFIYCQNIKLLYLINMDFGFDPYSIITRGHNEEGSREWLDHTSQIAHPHTGKTKGSPLP